MDRYADALLRLIGRASLCGTAGRELMGAPPYDPAHPGLTIAFFQGWAARRASPVALCLCVGGRREGWEVVGREKRVFGT